jgi:hypothetical protein
MPIAHEDSRWSNSGSPAAAFEARVTPSVGAGREVMQDAGENTTSPARTFEARIQQTGT